RRQDTTRIRPSAPPPACCTLQRVSTLPSSREDRALALTATVHHVDLTRGSVETRILPEDVYRKYPGGSALAAYLLLQTMPGGAAPSGPNIALWLPVSPPTAPATAGKSGMTAGPPPPLRGAMGDSQCGGFFPAEMRAAGADAFVFTGQSKEPVYLWLHDGT